MPDDRLMQVISHHWGFRELRPLQEPAMRAVLQGRDSLVVMPTGGGKSLCYQAPAMVRGDTTVVVSPLIALMKDQVDGLLANGVPAIQLDSSQSMEEQYAYEMDIRQGMIRLLFVSPERLVTTQFLGLLRSINVRSFAIDEAHCISHWGHDFRPDYRQLSQLKEMFPDASVHGYTATATEKVRNDIIQQLRLRQPEVLVGSFDRPNLTYRIMPRLDKLDQICEVLDRHRNEAGIIYCIRRKDVDELTADLTQRGYKPMPYHAGMTPETRKATQNAFSQEQCNLVVATVAFGMGIDRSNIRFIIHGGMPKSIEHYQQETGRAGRDGLEAECVLLHSLQDKITWEWLAEKSVEEANADRRYLASAKKHIGDMNNYCTNVVCRHRALVQYFGQKYPSQSCQACDICLGDAEAVPDSLVVAQKILSCVARVQEGFGVVHVVAVLRGQNEEKVRKYQHDKLSTFGLLKEHPPALVRNWIQQLIGQDVLVQTGDDYPVLKLNPASWEVMRNQRPVRLLQPIKRQADELPVRSKADAESWQGVDRDLFEEMREVRRELADKRGVPPYLIFSDATLRELARVRPSSLEQMRLVYGVGEAKLREHGQRFLKLILVHHNERHIGLDVIQESPPPRRQRTARAERFTRTRSPQHQLAFKLFDDGAAVEDIMHQTQRSRNWVIDNLACYIKEERPNAISEWLAPDVYQKVAEVVERVGEDRLKPIFVELGEQVSYEEIRLVVAHLQTKPRQAKKNQS